MSHQALAKLPAAPKFSPAVNLPGKGAMPFSSLSDPFDIARAHAALEAVWSEVKPSVPEHEYERERTRVAHLIAGCAAMALDEDDLKQNVLLQYRQSPPT